MELGIASVAAITAIAYLLGMAVKATEAADKWIPIICGAAGLILGVVAWEYETEFEIGLNLSVFHCIFHF